MYGKMVKNKMSKSNIIIASIVFLFFINCSSKSGLKCFEDEQKIIKNEKVYYELRTAFKDTLATWISMELQPKRNLEDQIYKLDDALMCNSNRTRCIMFLLMESLEGPIIYSTKFIGCELNEEGSWDFYYRSYPVTSYPYLKSEYNGFEYMRKETYMELIIDGLIKNCEIDDQYLSSKIWFSNDRKVAHQNFLKDIP